MGCGGSNAGDSLRNQQQQQQKLTEQSVGQINNAFAGFGPQFYQGVQDAYSKYQLPQLQQQYQGMRDQLGYKMANQGLTNSSAAGRGQQALNTSMNQGQQQVANQAVGQANQLRQQVGQEQSNLIGQAQNATSPSSIGQQATAMAAGFGAPSTFQPIGNMFGNFANLWLGGQQANTFNPFTQSLLMNQQNPGFGFSGALPSPTNYQGGQ